MGKNDRNNKVVDEVIDPIQEEVVNTDTENGIPGEPVNSGDEIEPAIGEPEIVEGELNITESQEILGSTDVKESDENQQDITDETDEIQQGITDETLEDTTPVVTYITLADAIEFSKDNSVEDTIEYIYLNAEPDLKIYGAELKDIIATYNKKSEYESNNGNRKLYSLLQRVLEIADGTTFKFKFDLVNRLFKDNEFFQPATLLNCTVWTKSEKELSNFAQVITIIEDLADRSTRNENKKRIANLSNLSLSEKALENIKNYYKL